MTENVDNDRSRKKFVESIDFFENLLLDFFEIIINIFLSANYEL